MSRKWSSILHGVANTADDAMREYVFEGGDDKVERLPPRVDDKIAAIQRHMARRVELQAEDHRISMEIGRLQDAIAEQLKAAGMVAKRGGE